MKRALHLFVGVLTSGALLALALPPHGWSFVGWIMLLPVLVTSRRGSFALGFASGILTALVAACIDAQVWRSSDSGIDQWTFAAFLLFGVVLGAVIGLWSATEKWNAAPWVLAAWATLFEACLLLLLPAHVALTQSQSTALLCLSSWTGIWGVSFLVWLSNICFSTAMHKHPYKALAAFASLTLLSVCWLPAERGPMNVGLIQTDTEDINELAALNKQAGRSQPRIVVWPELSGFANAYAGDTTSLIRVGQQDGQPPFVTTYEEPGLVKPYNVARIFSSEGQSVGYHKRKLFAGERQMHAAGNEAVAAYMDGMTYGLNICFDSCFPAVMRDTARQQDVALILLPTLDPNSDTGTIQAIHAAYSPFRAAELGLPIIRADTTAYSMIVDSHGRIITEVGHGEAVATANIKPGKRWTFVTWAGDWFVWICALLATTDLLSKKRAANTSEDCDVDVERSDQLRQEQAPTS